MAIRHEVTMNTTGGALTYSSPSNAYAGLNLSLQHNVENALVRLYVITWTWSPPEPAAHEFTVLKLMGQHPDGTEFTIDNISVKKPAGYNGWSAGQTGYLYADIPYDRGLNSHVGTTKCIAQFGTSSKADCAYARFNIEVSDPTLITASLREYDLDIGPATPPLNIYLSQYDIDYVIKFKLFSSQYKCTHTYGAASPVYLRGVRPDGEELDIPATIESGYDKYQSGAVSRYIKIVLDGQDPNVGSLITEVPGEFDASFVFMDKSSSNPKLHKIRSATQRIHFNIEKIE